MVDYIVSSELWQGYQHLDEGLSDLDDGLLIQLIAASGLWLCEHMCSPLTCSLCYMPIWFMTVT